MTLDRVPPASRIFLDPTIFIYHATGTRSSARPDFVRRLQVYQKQIERIPLMDPG